MKKKYLLRSLMLLIFICGVSITSKAETFSSDENELPQVAVSEIVSGQKYNLKHVVTGMYLQFLDNGDGDFCLNPLPSGSNANFDFIFTTVDAMSNTFMLGINSGGNSGYMSGSGWNIQLANPSSAAQKQIILLDQGDDVIRLRAGWSTNNTINFDCIDAACRLYANKGGTDNANFVIELSPNADDLGALIVNAKVNLQVSITAAQELFDRTVGGNEPGQYTGKDDFGLAIAAAKSVYNNSSATLQEVLTTDAEIIAAIAAYRLTKINPYIGYKFKLKHFNSDNYVSKSTDDAYTNARIQPLDIPDNDQSFEFVSEPSIVDGVRLMASDGSFLTHSGYTSSWTTSPAAGSNISIEDDESGYIKLKFASSNNYFGTDGTGANSSIYTDKNGNSDNHRWVIIVLDTRISFRNLIVSAESRLSASHAGTAIGDHPQAAIDALSSAIATAKVVYNNEDATEEELDLARIALESAIDEFISLEIVTSTPYIGKPLWITHSSGHLLSKVDYSENAVIHNLNEPEAKQIFNFESVPGKVDVVALKSLDDKYLYYDGWNTLWSDTIRSESQMQISNTDDGYLVFKFLGKNYLGVNSSIDSATVFSDKNNSDIKNKWMVQTPGSAVKIKLRATIVQADTLLNYVKVGTSDFEFPQADVNTFNSVLSAARNTYDEEAATQTQIDTRVEELQNALNTFYQTQIIPIFSPETIARYYVTNKQYSGYVTQNNVRALLDQNVPLTAWEFVKVRDSVFVMKQNDLAVAHSLNMVPYNNTQSDQQWYVHYDGPKSHEIFTPVDDYYFSFTKDSITNVIQVSSNGNLQIGTSHSHTAQNQWFKIQKQGAPITDALESLITNVTTTLEASKTGTAYGEYPIEAKDALTIALSEAQNTLDNVSAKTQLDINNAYVALENARKLFLNQKIVWRPVEGMAYLIGNRDNANYLSVDPENPAQVKGLALDATTHTDQLWFFVPVANKAGFYHIVNGSRSVGTSGGTSVFVQEYDASNASQLEVVYQNTTNGIPYFTLTSANTYPNIYINSDGKIATDRFTYNNYQIKLVEAGALRTEILLSQLLLDKATAGNGIGQYPETAFNTFATEILSAYEVAKDNDADEAAKDAALSSLLVIRDTFIQSQNGYGLELDALLTAVNRGNELIENTKIIGNEPGKISQSFITALKAAITDSQNASGGLTQSKVDANVAELSASIATFETQLKESTGLVTLIDESIAQHEAAVEGEGAGQYASGSKALFNEAIEQAQLVLAAVPVVQSNLLAATEALHVARDEFNMARKSDLDTRDLEDLIAEADAFLASKDISEFIELREALSSAKELMASNNKTQDDIDDMTELLFVLLDGTSVNSVYNKLLHIYNKDGNLFVTGISEQVIIKVYTMNGMLVSQEKTSDNMYNLSVRTGSHIVHVEGANTNLRTIVIGR